MGKMKSLAMQLGITRGEFRNGITDPDLFKFADRHDSFWGYHNSKIVFADLPNQQELDAEAYAEMDEYYREQADADDAGMQDHYAAAEEDGFAMLEQRAKIRQKPIINPYGAASIAVTNHVYFCALMRQMRDCPGDKKLIALLKAEITKETGFSLSTVRRICVYEFQYWHNN